MVTRGIVYRISPLETTVFYRIIYRSYDAHGYSKKAPSLVAHARHVEQRGDCHSSDYRGELGMGIDIDDADKLRCTEVGR